MGWVFDSCVLFFNEGQCMSFLPSPIKEDVDFVIQDGNDCIGGLLNSSFNSLLNSPTYTINALPHSSPNSPQLSPNLS